MNQFIAMLTIVISLLSHSEVYAGEGYVFTEGVVKPNATNQYMVSAVLKLDGTDATIRLVQSIEKAASKEEAIGIAFKKIQAQFTGYTLVDSIAQVIYKEPMHDCLYL